MRDFLRRTSGKGGTQLLCGECRRAGDTLDSEASRRQYTGHERDAATGLDYMLARYVGLSLGMFTSTDPQPGGPRVPRSWNRYAYVRNNPVVRVDPDGQRDEYLKYESTQMAIVVAYRLFVAHGGSRETGASAYEQTDGNWAIAPAVGPIGSSEIPFEEQGGPIAPKGKSQLALGYEMYRGSAHVHPSEGEPRPSIDDRIVLSLDNRAMGIIPALDPDAAVDHYAISADGIVVRYNYGPESDGKLFEVVGTVADFERMLGLDTSASPTVVGEPRDPFIPLVPDSGRTADIPRGNDAQRQDPTDGRQAPNGTGL